MMLTRRCVAFEVKALRDDDGTRTFEGYGSVFNTVDTYNDTIVKGAFQQTLKEWKARKKLPKMLLQHGGGGFLASNADDMVPIGKWDQMVEDEYGLYMKGRLFDVDTDRAKATYAALKAGELDGLSIGFRTRKSTIDEDTGIRTLTDIQLFEVSLVTFPANDPARVTEVRFQSNIQEAVRQLRAAMDRHQRHMDGTEPPDDASQQQMMREMEAAMNALDDEALMGSMGAAAQGRRDLMTERDFEEWIRREGGFTRAQAKCVLAKGYRQVLREAASDGDSHHYHPEGPARGSGVKGYSDAALKGALARILNSRPGAPTHGH